MHSQQNAQKNNGNYSISNASVNEAEYMWYRWKPDITLPPQKCLYVK